MRMRLFVVAMTVLLSALALTVTRLPEVGAQPAVTNIAVKVYFSKFSDTNPAHVLRLIVHRRRQPLPPFPSNC